MMMSIRQLTIGLYCVRRLAPRPGRGAARNSPQRRFPTLRPASAITSKPRSAGGIRRRISRSRASRWACSARRIDAVADLGIEKKQIPELRIVLRPGRKHKFRINYLPMSYSAVCDGASRVRLQRHPVQRQPAGVHRALVEDVAPRLRVRLHLPRSRVRRGRVAGQGDRHPGDSAGRAARNASSRARRRPFPRSAASGASTSCRTSRSPASSTSSRFPKPSTSATRRTTSTSICTAR